MNNQNLAPARLSRRGWPRARRFAVGVVALASIQAVWGAGTVDRVAGEVSVLDLDAKPRAVTQGDRLRQGETIVTGREGELLLLTDDSGALAVRPFSRVLIERYQANGTADDSAVLRLLRGGLRAVTGWIAKSAPKNHRVVTATATIGVRGTDHEVQVVDEGAEAGTHSRVRDGAVTLANEAGSLDIEAGQVGRAASAGMAPVALPQPVEGVFKPALLDARLDAIKPQAERNAPVRLQEKQRALRTGGGTSAQSPGLNTAPISSGAAQISTQCAPGSPALRIFEEVLRAYESGDIATLQRRLDPSFIGYASVIDAALRERQQQFQARIFTLDRTMQCGPNVSVINFAWEKRYLAAAGLTPQLQTGRASLLIFGAGNDTSSNWRVTSIAGSSPFVAPAVPIAPAPLPGPAPAPMPGQPGAPAPTPGTPPAPGTPAPAPVSAPPAAPASFIATPSVVSFSTLPQSCAVPPPATTVPVTLNVGATQGASLPPGTPSTAASCLPPTGFFAPCTVTASGGASATALGDTVVSGPACTGVIVNNQPIALITMPGTTSQVVNVPPGVPTTVTINVPTSRVFNGTNFTPGTPYTATATGVKACQILVGAPPAPAPAAPVCTPTAGTVAVNWTITDPARGAVASVPVLATTNAGDRQTFFATPVGGGRYMFSSLPVTANAAGVTPDNGRLELFGGALITLTYQPASGPALVQVLSVTP